MFLNSQLKQERERKIERLGKRQALYTSLYFPRGIRSRKWRSYAAIFGVRDTAYFRCCASSSLGIFLRAYVASWLATFRAFRSHVLFFLFHRCELRTSRTELLESVQKFACKVCLKCWDMDYQSMLHCLDIPPLSVRRRYLKLITMFNIVNGQSFFPPGIFEPQSPSHTIRGTVRLKIFVDLIHALITYSHPMYLV